MFINGGSSSYIFEGNSRNVDLELYCKYEGISLSELKILYNKKNNTIDKIKKILGKLKI